jgi:hypothetical protein
MKRTAHLLLLAIIALLLTAQGTTNVYARQSPPAIYAQKLIDRALAKHKEVATLAMHVTPPDGPDNVIIASNFGRIGKKADEDDLSVLNSGKPRAEVGKNGDRFSVELPLQDASGHTVGVLAVAFPYKIGDDKGALQKRAERIRNEFRSKIPSLAKLFGPA